MAPLTPDDELLASAFRKILSVISHRYSMLELDEANVALTLDDTYTEADGLTVQEIEAIGRVLFDALPSIEPTPPTRCETCGRDYD